MKRQGKKIRISRKAMEGSRRERRSKEGITKEEKIKCQ